MSYSAIATCLFMSTCLLLGGCGDSSGVDGGSPDANPPDGAALDGRAPDASLGDASSPDGSRLDASVPDGSVVDATLPDAARMEGGAPDSGALCDLSAIMRIPRSPEPVMVGTLCDEVYACAADRAEANRIEDASVRFVCTMEPRPGSACSAFTCSYHEPGGVGILDAAAIRQVCEVATLVPMPPMRCVVFI